MKTMSMKTGTSRRVQGAAGDAIGLQPGACASAVGVGALEDVSPKRAARSVQPAGVSERCDEETPSRNNTNMSCGERSYEDAGSASGEKSHAASPAAESVSDDVDVRRADGERCDAVGFTPGGEMIVAGGSEPRLLHFPGSPLVRSVNRMVGACKSARVWCRWARSRKGAAAAKFRRIAFQRLESARSDRQLVDDARADALGAFLLIEKGGVA